MIVPCPICDQDMPSESILIPLTGGIDFCTLAQKINPTWTLKNGCCENCINQLTKTLLEVNNDSEGNGVGYATSFYRHHMNRRERGQWHHCNPDMQKWRREQIIEIVSEEAIALSYQGWMIFDEDESMVVQGIHNEP